jgi:DNA recombination protein RmuC
MELHTIVTLVLFFITALTLTWFYSQRKLTLSELKKVQTEKTNQNIELSTIKAELQNKNIELAEIKKTLSLEKIQNEERIQFLQEAKEQLTNQFKVLASEILEDKSKKFTEQNQNNLDNLLGPLKTKITEFKSVVEELYIKEGKDRTALSEQVKQLFQLNQQLSQDAHNLTKALKGQVKTQGAWGEFILEKILEESGLVKDIHYKTQDSHTRDDGSRAQPDVILFLPENKNLIIDAKVSLIGYEEYVNSESNIEKESALKKHLTSIKQHIKTLSQKNYQDIYQLKSIDFVIMFIPIEGAFLLPMSTDNGLWQEAWKQNILLVSPSTLLFVVRTVAHLWRQEQQTKNSLDISKRGAELYDKLAGFIEDFEKVGKNLNLAKDSYDNAFSKLRTGRGNVIRQAEMLRELGVKPSKNLQIHSLDP